MSAASWRQEDRRHGRRLLHPGLVPQSVRPGRTAAAVQLDALHDENLMQVTICEYDHSISASTCSSMRRARRRATWRRTSRGRRRIPPRGRARASVRARRVPAAVHRPLVGKILGRFPISLPPLVPANAGIQLWPSTGCPLSAFLEARRTAAQPVEALAKTVAGMAECASSRNSARAPSTPAATDRRVVRQHGRINAALSGQRPRRSSALAVAGQPAILVRFSRLASAITRSRPLLLWLVSGISGNGPSGSNLRASWPRRWRARPCRCRSSPGCRAGRAFPSPRRANRPRW